MNNNNSKSTEYFHNDNIFFQNQKTLMKSKYIANKKAYFILKVFNDSSFSSDSIYSMKGGGCGDESIDDGTGSCGGNKSYD